MAQHDFQVISRQDCPALAGPLNRGYGRTCEVLLQADRFDLASRAKPVQIDVSQWHSAAILVDEHEGRAADGRYRSVEPCGNAADQGSFSRPQRAEEGKGFPTFERRTDGPAEPIGVMGGE